MQLLDLHPSQSRRPGFTLVELMVTVAIVGILAVLAFPQYSQYMVRAHHASGEQFLMDVAQRQEQYFLDGHAYAPDLATLGMPAPPEVTNYYTVDAFVISTNPPGYQMSLTPLAGGIMDGNGTLVITNITASVSTQ